MRFTAGDGKAVCHFRLAVKRPFKKDETDWINCVCFGKMAETISQYFVKGSQIAVTGSIRTGSYDAQDGTKRYTTDVMLESFEFVGSNNSNNNSNNGGYNDSFGGGSFNNDITPVDNSSDLPF